MLKNNLVRSGAEANLSLESIEGSPQKRTLGIRKEFIVLSALSEYDFYQSIPSCLAELASGIKVLRQVIFPVHTLINPQIGLPPSLVEEIDEFLQAWDQHCGTDNQKKSFVGYLKSLQRDDFRTLVCCLWQPFSLSHWSIGNRSILQVRCIP